MAPVDVKIGNHPAIAEWPDESWMSSATQGRGRRPLPFQEFVLKVHGRCNLSCDYCYMYEMADQSWRALPGAMSERVIDQAARRIGEHARTYEIDRVDVCFHGGEPLLAGREFFVRAARTLRRHIPG